jgi:hypothetical protein
VHMDTADFQPQWDSFMHYLVCFQYIFGRLDALL